MAEENSTCSKCGCAIPVSIAVQHNGLCASCQQTTREAISEEAVFERIDEAIEPFTSYKNAMTSLSTLPRGFALCFAFHYVHADILNGGISQLYSNSTWPLIVDAVEAAETAQVPEVASVLREIVYYYHKKDRSKLKRRVKDDFFPNLEEDWDKSLAELEDAYFEKIDQADTVIPNLCQQGGALFASPSANEN